jgi:histidinol-phosphate aminotransferase
MSDQLSLPSTWVPQDPYSGPGLRNLEDLKLDGNEGSMPPKDLLVRLSEEDQSVLRDYPNLEGLEIDIADWIGVDREQIVVTSGADDALDRVCRSYLRPGRQMVLPIPAFEMMYRFAAKTGGEIKTVPWENNFPTEAVIAALDKDVALVTIISPNNPTGLVATPEDLRRISESASRAIVILDHVYVDYAEDDLTDLAVQLKNVVTIRSFSKAWGLAGCRVGYAIAPKDIANVLRNAGSPFPVSGLSIAAVSLQIQESQVLLDEHVNRICTERDVLTEILTRLSVKPVPSQGNFVFADFGERANLVYDGLASLGILVRRFPHRPEIATGIRITVPENSEDMERLKAGLETVLAPEGILFDLDGVLADVEESYRRCVLETAQSFGITITRNDLEDAVLAGDANNDWVLTQRIMKSRGVEAPLDEITRQFQEIYIGTLDNPGLREYEKLLVNRNLLEQLSARLPLGIVTGRPQAEARWFLEKNDISELFAAVVCMEDAKIKPDPEPVRVALTRLGIERAWMVGDTPDDLRAAKAAGVLPVGIVAPGDNPTKTFEALNDAGAAIILDDITNLEELIL